MARARNIKPGFFSNDDLVELPFETRLLFIGIWTIADRAGRLLDRPKKIKMDVFPGDNVDVETCLEQLAGRGFIVRYEAMGIKAIQVVNWGKHQNPHVKEAASTIPEQGQTEQSTMPAPCKSGAGMVLAPEIPERAGLIPDSLNLIPDTPSPQPAKKQKPASTSGEPKAAKPSALPDWVPADAWAGYLEMRRKQKKVPTERAIELVIDQLAVLRDTGQDVAAVLDKSTAMCWTDVYPIRNSTGRTDSAGQTGMKLTLDQQNAANTAEAKRLLGIDNDDGRTIDAN